MAQTRSAGSDFTRAFGEAKKHAGDIAGDAADTAQDIYDHAREGASEFAGNAGRAARKSADSFGRALRVTIETQPYTAVAVALGIGWLLGRTHRPL